MRGLEMDLRNKLESGVLGNEHIVSRVDQCRWNDE